MHNTSCWASVSSRWTWGVMREWSLPRISSTGKADSRKPRACISHMHWLLCTQTHTVYLTHDVLAEKPRAFLFTERDETGKGWRLFTHLVDFFHHYILQTKHAGSVNVSACSSFNGKHDEFCGHMSDLWHSQDVLSIGAEVMSALPADPLQSRHTGHRQLCLYKALEHHG